MFSGFLTRGGGILESAAELGNNAVIGLEEMAKTLKNKVTGVGEVPSVQDPQPPPTGQLAGRRRRRGRKSRKASRKARKTRKH